MDRLDRRLHLLVAENNRAEHDVLGKLLRLRFHHQDGVLGARYHEVELAFLELCRRGVEHVFAVDAAHAGGPDRAVERNAGNSQRRRDSDQCRNVGIDFGIARKHVRNHLHFIVKPVRKQRTDGPVDQTGGQCLLFRRPAFALEEAARNLASGIGLLDVIAGERQEVLPCLGLPRSNHRAEHDGVVHVHHDRSVRLARHFAGFQRHLARAVGERLLDGG